MTNLGPRERILRDPRQADNSHNTQHKGNAIIIVFLTGTTGTMINRDRQGSMKSRIKCILPITLPPHLHSLQDLTCVVALLCNLQKRNHVHLKFLQPSRNTQIDVYQELTRSNKEKEHDALFTLIPVFHGDRTQCEQWVR